ncbi:MULTISPECIES: hypothetical protein [Erwinia]|uniref:Uncharacterized protein n=2 Tax=Erwinia TaxID=551 RepID=A0A4U3E9P4_9GAMM|nr:MULTISPECIES: hypothetical protein [Erwinia]MBD8109413.1 hypothetical protein [Erwinia persicina]MBD8212500.1 hypothetical protein [Erwinia persicina]MDN4629778.1 hypothetical protein [Erwinia sp. PsM31]TKJ76150.1 hypothetical protein EpCFBP13511_24840 [Erwinia persicina]
MKHVGFCGGSSFFELGSPSDMVRFFDVLHHLSRNERERNLLERLYKKYVNLDEIGETQLVIQELKSLSHESFLMEFSKYFESIEWCFQSAKAFYEDWNIYQAVKIIITDMPYCVSDIDRPKEEYDVLTSDDMPFWLR